MGNNNKKIVIAQESIGVDKNPPKQPLTLPAHLSNRILMKMIEIKSCGNYSRLVGGDFTYVYESVMNERGIKCRFEIQSNAPLNDIEPLAVNVHTIGLTVYKINKKDERETLIHSSTDNMTNGNLQQLEENRSKIAKINSIVGIDKLSYSDRASWDILMGYIGVSKYFGYYRIVVGSKNRERLRADYSDISMGYGRSSLYNMTCHKSELKGLTARNSWIYSDISKGSYIQMLEYEGKRLEYSESLNQDQTIGTMTITFNDDIIYKALYPYERIERPGIIYVPINQGPNYVSGMIVEIDNRNQRHLVFLFVEQIIQLLLGEHWKYESFSELEQEWCCLCEDPEYHDLAKLFNFGNYKATPSWNLEKPLNNSSTFSDIVFLLN